nr:hypothetical protein [Escherichia sp. TW09308]
MNGTTLFSAVALSPARLPSRFPAASYCQHVVQVRPLSLPRCLLQQPESFPHKRRPPLFPLPDTTGQPAAPVIAEHQAACH